MAIKKSIYKIHNGNDFDTYHFQTDQNSVKVLDSSNNVLGSIHDYLFNGKTITTGNVKDIKVTGLYLTKGLGGLPTGVSATTEILIAVQSIQNKVFTYQLFNTDGSIFNKTIVGTSDKGWSSGGTSLQNSVENIISIFGTLANLKTTNKSNLVEAINEVLAAHDGLKRDFGLQVIANNEYQKHNHDSSYLRKDVRTNLDSDITLASVGGMKLRAKNAGKDNIISVSATNEILLGNDATSLNIQSKNMLLHNGKKVWTEVNDGKDSGLDADLLHGVKATSYARKDTSNTYSSSQVFNEVATMKKGINLANGAITQNESNGLNVRLGARNAMTLDANGTLNVTHANLVAETGDVSIKMKQSKNDNGVGLHVSQTNGLFQLYNWDANSSIMKVQKNSKVAEFVNHLSIQGKNLYLQSTTPTGSNHPVGSVWISS